MVKGTKNTEAEISGHYTMDGAGVRLLRVFGGPSSFKYTDPFLLLDYFGSSIPSEYEKGFPWHPHRGIETITYQIKGRTDHEDSNGNKGTIFPGDVQDMSSGSGIFHEEMPSYFERDKNNEFSRSVLGLQLWINTPADRKMKTPQYAYNKGSSIPEYRTDSGSRIRIFAGTIDDVTGPFRSPYDLGLNYFHIRIGEGEKIELNEMEGKRAIIFNFSGNVKVQNDTEVVEKKALIFDRDGGRIIMEGRAKESDLILVAGNPTDEPIEWYGPVS